MDNKKLTLHDKWSKDADSYEKGAKIKTSYPQCESCIHYIKGDALKCKKYTSELKPKGVLFAHTECIYYDSSEPLKVEVYSEKQNRFLGGIFGFCVGDMLGVPVEFSSRQERDADPVKELRAYGTYHQPFGSWSDDSSLMLCLMDALMSDDVLEQLKNNMIAYYKEGLFTPRGQMFDIGNSTRYAIENMERGMKIAELLKRPNIDYNVIKEIDAVTNELNIPFDVSEQVEILVKYDGYLKRQEFQVEQASKLYKFNIPDDIVYSTIYHIYSES